MTYPVNLTVQLEQLRRRAKKHGLLIRKIERGENSYTLVWADTNIVPADVVAPLTLEQVEQWLDAAEKANIEG